MRVSRFFFLFGSILFACICSSASLSAATLVVSSNVDSTDGTCDINCSLRDAVSAANDGDTITFGTQFNSPTTITLLQGQILIAKSLTIAGPGSNTLTISGNNAGRIFRISDGAVVSLSGMTIRDGRIGSNANDVYGGGIWVTDSTLTLTNVVVSNNTARFVSTNPPAQFGYGGAIASFNSSLSVINSNVSGNTAPLTGGIYCRDGGFLNVSGSKFLTNASTAIRLEGGQNLSVNSSWFEGNGSAVSASSSNRVVVVNSTITGNGAGIGLEANSELIVDRTIIKDGNATSSPNASGGGIFNKGVATISNSQINNNRVSGDAGGIWNNGTMYLFACAITNNSALRSAGGIKNSGRLFLTNSTVSGNSADLGGGFGSSPGGGITNGSLFGGSILITNSTIANNRSTGHGGGIMHDNSGSVSIRNTIVASNHSNQSSHDVSGTFVSQGFNLISNINGSTGWLGTDILNVNALLAPLSNNGGGTLTHALLPMSPAIDAGNDANAIDPTTSFGFSRDQRGEVRFLGSPNLTVDIGALESNLSSAPVSLSGRVLSSNGPGISKVRLSINNGNGGVFQAMTSSLGYYKFENLTPGTTYTITIIHKNYQFSSPQSITIENNRSDLDFVAIP
ncbi:MAG: carboxypeptidase regulatory-like domain-containing protein [Blastocatellia bacterium]|nr:carboxypeptidase regulatory-like domain-containing protein [Blastocatellia bacterium]